MKTTGSERNAVIKEKANAEVFDDLDFFVDKLILQKLEVLKCDITQHLDSACIVVCRSHGTCPLNFDPTR